MPPVIPSHDPLKITNSRTYSRSDNRTNRHPEPTIKYAKILAQQEKWNKTLTDLQTETENQGY